MAKIQTITNNGLLSPHSKYEHITEIWNDGVICSRVRDIKNPTLKTGYSEGFMTDILSAYNEAKNNDFDFEF